MLNKIDLMGRLTRDPELRYTQAGTPVASLSLAVDRDFAPKDGGDKQTDFIDCVAWRQTGEFVSKYFQKGSMAVVTGRLQIRDWQDKEGNKRRSAEIVAEHVYFGGSKKENGNTEQDRVAPSGKRYPNGVNVEGDPMNGSGAFSELSEGDGDLPF